MAEMQVALSIQNSGVVGGSYVIIDNDGTDVISGTFQNLPEGTRWVDSQGFAYKVTYQGGDGNDVELQSLGRPPVIVDQRFTINERRRTGSYVGTVLATDGDTNDPPLFEILSGNESGAFHIDSATGELTIADDSQIDFDIAPSYTLTVQVTDGNLLTDAAIILIDIVEATLGSDLIGRLNGQWWLAKSNCADGFTTGCHPSTGRMS